MRTLNPETRALNTGARVSGAGFHISVPEPRVLPRPLQGATGCEGCSRVAESASPGLRSVSPMIRSVIPNTQSPSSSTQGLSIRPAKSRPNSLLDGRLFLSGKPFQKRSFEPFFCPERLKGFLGVLTPRQSRWNSSSGRWGSCFRSWDSDLIVWDSHFGGRGT